LAPMGSDSVGPDDALTPAPTLVTAIEAMEHVRMEMNASAAGTQHLLLAVAFTCVEIDAMFAAQNITTDAIRQEILRISG
jgi:hypothetical protein